jgi:hypothetical protein
MKSFVYPLLVASLFCLCGCSSPNNKDPELFSHNGSPATTRLLVGRWVGEISPNPTEKRRWVCVRKSDGTYTIDFEVTYNESQQVRYVHESGRWSVSGDFYQTNTTLVDGKPTDPMSPYFSDIYRIESLTETSFTYRHMQTKQRYTVHRVS